MKHTIDATGKKPGRLATELAVLLMGKNRTDYSRNKIPDMDIEVTNAGAMSFDSKKLIDKKYATHSGYPGGIKLQSMEKMIAKKGGKEVLRMAVLGMLPKNKLRAQMMKNLTIKE
ncbi:MAG: large subunit ribosomal protein L13 [Parcubacteria bacterium C7867-005]|nr:MAG: large subunit ribosomal protein L13 [Parcubacteria bacterium C7867-005]